MRFSISFEEYQRHGFGGDSLFSAYHSEMLHCLCFHVNVIRRDTKDLGNLGLHLREIREQFWPLGQNVRIDIADFVTFLPNKVGSVAQELQTRHSLVAIVGIGKHFADIAETTGSEQCVRNRMTEDVTIGMANQ